MQKHPGGRRPKFGTRANRLLTIRMTRDQERRLKELAAKQRLTVSDYVRSVVLTVELAATNPAGVAAFAAAGDGEISVERQLVNQVELERAGQRRLPAL